MSPLISVVLFLLAFFVELDHTNINHESQQFQLQHDASKQHPNFCRSHILVGPELKHPTINDSWLRITV